MVKYGFKPINSTIWNPMTSHHVTVKWQQNYFYMFKLISTVDSLLTNTSLKRTPTVGPSLSRSLLLVDSVCNTRLLCAALNVSWRDYISNKELYGDLSPISTSLQIRRLQFSGHCWRSKNETVSQLLLSDPKHDRRSRGAQQQHLLIN